MVRISKKYYTHLKKSISNTQLSGDTKKNNGAIGKHSDAQPLTTVVQPLTRLKTNKMVYKLQIDLQKKKKLVQED